MHKKRIAGWMRRTYTLQNYLKNISKHKVLNVKKPSPSDTTSSSSQLFQVTPEHSNPTQYLFLMLQTCFLTSPYLLHARPPAQPPQHAVRLPRVSLVQWRSSQMTLPRLVSFRRSTRCYSK